MLIAEVPRALTIAIVASVIGLAITIAAGRCWVKAPHLHWANRIVAAFAFTPLSLFCAWGFAASMEPGDYHVIWRVLYAAVFVACTLAIGRLLFARPANADAS